MTAELKPFFSPIAFDGFVKSPISALCAISQNFTYVKYAAFFEIAQALILNFLQSRQIVTFYECIAFVRSPNRNSQAGGFSACRQGRASGPPLLRCSHGIVPGNREFKNVDGPAINP